MKRWREFVLNLLLEKKPYFDEGATYQMPIKDQRGDVIGVLKLNENGTFVGTIYSGLFRDEIDRVVNLGFTDGILMKALVHPPTLPWQKP